MIVDQCSMYATGVTSDAMRGAGSLGACGRSGRPPNWFEDAAPDMPSFCTSGAQGDAANAGTDGCGEALVKKKVAED